MKLENLQIALARRNPWQATDLGLQVARKHYKPMFLISLMLVCVLSLLLWALCQNAALACLLLFWFKPIVERPLLFFISRAIFADAPTIKQSLLSLSGVSNRLWFKTLFVYRFSLSRSFNDPVVLLSPERRPTKTFLLSVKSSLAPAPFPINTELPVPVCQM